MTKTRALAITTRQLVAKVCSVVNARWLPCDESRWRGDAVVPNSAATSACVLGESAHEFPRGIQQVKALQYNVCHPVVRQFHAPLPIVSCLRF